MQYALLCICICIYIYILLFNCSMEGSDICFEVVRRAVAGFIYSEAVAWYGAETDIHTHAAQ